MGPITALSLPTVDEFVDSLAKVPDQLLSAVVNVPYERPILSLVLLGFVIFVIWDLVDPFRKPTR